ncbi:hypothetical protein SALB1_1723 [Salinisphaera sp. LB1]|nr:hypothetical protein SALB1_1723 [Salinisphaera sp. LB1]
MLVQVGSCSRTRDEAEPYVSGIGHPSCGLLTDAHGFRFRTNSSGQEGDRLAQGFEEPPGGGNAHQRPERRNLPDRCRALRVRD